MHFELENGSGGDFLIMLLSRCSDWGEKWEEYRSPTRRTPPPLASGPGTNTCVKENTIKTKNVNKCFRSTKTAYTYNSHCKSLSTKTAQNIHAKWKHLFNELYQNNAVSRRF